MSKDTDQQKGDIYTITDVTNEFGFVNRHWTYALIKFGVLIPSVCDLPRHNLFSEEDVQRAKDCMQHGCTPNNATGYQVAA